MPPKAKKTKTEAADTPKPVRRKKMYPEIHTVWYTKDTTAKNADEFHQPPLTIADMKKALGWEEVEVTDEGWSPELHALTGGRYIRMTRNNVNRPLIVSWLGTLKQEHLRRKWRLNGDAIVIGEYGNVLSGQHRLISAILAEIVRPTKPYYLELSPNEITLETCINYGIDESDDTFKTLNQGYKGTIADSLYRSPYFAKFPFDQRKTISRMMEYAIAFLWKRTGAKLNTFAKNLTPGEAFDFIERHPRLLRAVEHIFSLYRKDWQLNAKRLAPSYAAGLMYLMGAAESNGDEYRAKVREGLASEEYVDWKYWDKARDFWTNVVDVDKADFRPLRDMINGWVHPTTAAAATVIERINVCIKAWDLWLSGKKMREDNLSLEADYKPNAWQIQVLTYFPDLGGIDMGEPDKESAAKKATEEIKPEDVEAAKKAIRIENEEKTKFEGEEEGEKAGDNGKEEPKKVKRRTTKAKKRGAPIEEEPEGEEEKPLKPGNGSSHKPNLLDELGFIRMPRKPKAGEVEEDIISEEDEEALHAQDELIDETIEEGEFDYPDDDVPPPEEDEEENDSELGNEYISSPGVIPLEPKKPVKKPKKVKRK